MFCSLFDCRSYHVLAVASKDVDIIHLVPSGYVFHNFICIEGTVVDVCDSFKTSKVIFLATYPKSLSVRESPIAVKEFPLCLREFALCKTALSNYVIVPVCLSFLPDFFGLFLTTIICMLWAGIDSYLGHSFAAPITYMYVPGN